MGIVGDKDIIMRVVKCTDPNRINNSASTWLGYIFCVITIIFLYIIIIKNFTMKSEG